MPLPSPTTGTAQNAPSVNSQDPNAALGKEVAKEIKLSLADAISYGLKSGVMSTKQVLASKIPIFGKSIAEKIEFDKRSMREKEGRDPLTGRKLTQEELKERELRQKSQGAIGDIRDAVIEIQDILALQFGSSVRKRGKSKEKTIAEPTGDNTTSYALEGDEAAKLSTEEQQREQQAQDLENQKDAREQEQTFFEKLFEKYFGSDKKDGEATAQAQSGGLLGKIASIVDFAADIKSLRGGGIGRLGRGGGVGGLFRRGTPTPPMPTAPVPPAGAAPAAKGFFGRAIDSVRGVATRGVGLVKSGATAVANAGGRAVGAVKAGASTALQYGGKAVNAVKGLGGQISKMGFAKIAGAAMAALGPILTTAFAAMDINSIKQNQTLTASEKKKQIGLVIGETIGSLLGAGVGAVLGGPPGVLVSGILDALGIGPGALGGWLTEKIGPESVYDLAASIPLLGDMIKVPEEEGANKTMEGMEGQTDVEPMAIPEGMSVEDYLRDLGINSPTISAPSPAMPAITPTSAASLGNLQNENMSLKTAPTVAPVIAPTNNTIVNNNNAATVMGVMTTTRTGIDLDERAFRLALAY